MRKRREREPFWLTFSPVVRNVQVSATGSEADVLERRRVRPRRGRGTGTGTGEALGQGQGQAQGGLWALPRGEKAWTSGED